MDPSSTMLGRAMLLLSPLEFLDACANGHHERVLAALRAGMDPNLVVPEGRNLRRPLFDAVEQGHVQTVQHLLDAGATVTPSSWTIDRLNGRDSILFPALPHGQAMIERLIAAGADPCPEQTVIPPEDAHGLMPAAAHHNDPDLLVWLARVGVSVQAVDHAQAGRNALLVAAWLGHESLVRPLLSLGLNVNDRDTGGMTALHWAVRGSHHTVVQALLDAGADVFATDDQGCRPVDLTHVRSSRTHDLVHAVVRAVTDRAALHATLDPLVLPERDRRRL